VNFSFFFALGKFRVVDKDVERLENAGLAHVLVSGSEF
jgi:hypothetical protein